MKHHSLLMIPGPIEFEPDVLQALGAPTLSHVDAGFIETFGRAIERMREVWLAPTGQPLLLAGSGTLAMDVAGANLVEVGDRALVLSTGVFGDRFEDLLARYGAEVAVIRPPLGETVDFDEVEETLRGEKFKLMTATHVDTSTAVRVDAKRFGALGRKYGVLTILDGVCSVAGEEIRQEEWGLDIVLTASQKAIGVPPGLALLVVSKNALDSWGQRTTKAANYYGDWEKWMPIMASYENRAPSYFGTPAVNLVCALDVSLGHILDEGVERRFERHRTLGCACRAALSALNLGQIPTSADHAANTLSAVRYPDDVTGSELLAQIRDLGVTLAGGLHASMKNEYFRIGHMGSTTSGELLATLGALESGLSRCGVDIDGGSGVAVAQRVLQRS